MNERTSDRIRDARETSAAAGRRLVDTAQDVAGRAGAYVQARMGNVSDRAQALARDADARVEALTGRAVESWAEETRRLVRDHPLGAIAVTVALGYVLGKLVSGRSDDA